jgi:hypothetical protein
MMALVLVLVPALALVLVPVLAPVLDLQPPHSIPSLSLRHSYLPKNTIHLVHRWSSSKYCILGSCTPKIAGMRPHPR